MVANQLKGFLFTRTGGFFDRAGQGVQLRADLGFRDQVESSRYDRRFENSVAGESCCSIGLSPDLVRCIVGSRSPRVNSNSDKRALPFC